MATIPCTIIRGGTSKGVFVREDHLPSDPQLRDAVLLQLMGSPDPRQVDGLGGADPLTSKVAIVARSQRKGIDVEYESLEIGIAEARVNHGLMCGNLVAGVGYFALAEGLVAARGASTTISIYCRSNRKTIIARMPTAVPAGGGRERHERSAGSPVSLLFHDPGGAVTGKLLPAGAPLSRLAVGGRHLEVSIVDAGTLYAFVRAADFGLRGDEDVAELDANQPFRADIETLRAQAAAYINRQSFFGAPVVSPRLVKVAIVAPPDEPPADIVARVVNPAKVHKAYAVSGGICLAAAAAVRDTLVQRITGVVGAPFNLCIAHPSGLLSLGMHWSLGSQGTVIHFAEIQRTARVIMRGEAYVAAEFTTAAASATATAAASVRAAVAVDRSAGERSLAAGRLVPADHAEGVEP